MTEKQFTDIFAHRADMSDRQVRNGWLTFKATCSERTLLKFVARAKGAGVRSAFARNGRVGCLASDVE